MHITKHSPVLSAQVQHVRNGCFDRGLAPHPIMNVHDGPKLLTASWSIPWKCYFPSLCASSPPPLCEVNLVNYGSTNQLNLARHSFNPLICFPHSISVSLTSSPSQISSATIFVATRHIKTRWISCHCYSSLSFVPAIDTHALRKMQRTAC
jgi:hypothetical protein